MNQISSENVTYAAAPSRGEVQVTSAGFVNAYSLILGRMPESAEVIGRS